MWRKCGECGPRTQRWVVWGAWTGRLLGGAEDTQIAFVKGQERNLLSLVPSTCKHKSYLNDEYFRIWREPKLAINFSTFWMGPNWFFFFFQHGRAPQNNGFFEIIFHMLSKLTLNMRFKDFPQKKHSNEMCFVIVYSSGTPALRFSGRWLFGTEPARRRRIEGPRVRQDATAPKAC